MLKPISRGRDDLGALMSSIFVYNQLLCWFLKLQLKLLTAYQHLGPASWLFGNSQRLFHCLDKVQCRQCGVWIYLRMETCRATESDFLILLLCNVNTQHIHLDFFKLDQWCQTFTCHMCKNT